jgi:hypothetical protein
MYGPGSQFFTPAPDPTQLPSIDPGDFPGYGSGASAGASGGLSSWAQSSQGMKDIAGVTAVVAAGFGIYNGLHQGGAQGGFMAAGSAAGGASALFGLAGMTSVAAPLAIVALGAGIVTALLGDPKQIRAKQESDEIRNALYMAPPSVTVGADITGAQTRTDRSGMVGSNQFDAFAFQVNDPHYLTGDSGSRKNEVVPGTVIYLSMPITAWDAKSVMDSRNSIADAVQAAMQQSHPINYQIQAAAGK